MEERLTEPDPGLRAQMRLDQEVGGRCLAARAVRSLTEQAVPGSRGAEGAADPDQIARTGTGPGQVLAFPARRPDHGQVNRQTERRGDDVATGDEQIVLTGERTETAIERLQVGD